jgi:hypothetical protein
MVNKRGFEEVLPPNQKMAMVCAVLSIVGMTPHAEIVAQGMEDDDQFVIAPYKNACEIRRKSLFLQGNA